MLHIFKNRIFTKYSRYSLRALRFLIFDNNNELIRTRTNSGSIGLFNLFNSDKDNRPQSTQRAQSVVVFSVSSVFSVVFSNTYLAIGNYFLNFRDTLRSWRALRFLIFDNNNELIRTRTNSGSIGLFKLFNLKKDNRPQSMQRAQSVVVFSVSSVVFSNSYLPIENDISNFKVHLCS